MEDIESDVSEPEHEIFEEERGDSHASDSDAEGDDSAMASNSDQDSADDLCKHCILLHTGRERHHDVVL